MIWAIVILLSAMVGAVIGFLGAFLWIGKGF